MRRAEGALGVLPPGPAAEDGEDSGRIGPNAILQVGEALRALHGDAVTAEIHVAAGLAAALREPPSTMVDQRLVRALFAALYARLPAEHAEAVLRDAGSRTAAYLLAHRIPGPAQRLLRAVPAMLSSRLLLRAMAANAWTFAGSGSFRFRAGRRPRLEILDNPIPTPGCLWHAAVFEGLFEALVRQQTQVRAVACRADGSPSCRFEIRRPDAPGGRRQPAQSSASPS